MFREEIEIEKILLMILSFRKYIGRIWIIWGYEGLEIYKVEWGEFLVDKG